MNSLWAGHLRNFRGSSILILLLTLMTFQTILYLFSNESEKDSQKLTAEEFHLPSNPYFYSNISVRTNVPLTFEEQLRKDSAIFDAKLVIEDELRELIFGNHSYGKIFNSLEDVYGGNPRHNIIISQWRSGSTFLGEIVSSHPASFYVYEPLMKLGGVRLHEDSKARNALDVLSKLFRCDYNGLASYWKIMTKPKLIVKSPHISKYCKNEEDKLCQDMNFLSVLCKLFPIQTLKILRLRLGYTENFIEDDRLNAKVLLLIRDPRASFLSRKKANLCGMKSDCGNPKIICENMVADFHAYAELKKKYPDKYLAIRYEDICFRLEESVDKILNFYGLEFHRNIQDYLQNHTSQTSNKVYTTFRDPKLTPFKWMEFYSKNLTMLSDVQEVCSEALQLWGYQPFFSNYGNVQGNISTFVPIGYAPFPEMKVTEDSDYISEVTTLFTLFLKIINSS